MIDTHVYPENWGVNPVLFESCCSIPSYSLFIVLGLIVGLIVYFYEAKKNKVLSENTFYLLIAALVGGVLGAKLPIWIINFRAIIAALPDLTLFLTGRTIVGGLVGGFIAVLIAKKLLKIKVKRGNLFAPAIAMGVAIGRIGCFLRGCCYGVVTSLPWGVNFGDGLLRHPTQIYESIFMLGMFVYFQFAKKKLNKYPGSMFEILMFGYFAFRFFIEFIRVEKVVFVGLTMFQLVSIVVVIYFSFMLLKTFKYKKN